MRELSDILSLGLNDKYITSLNVALEGTWWSSTRHEDGKTTEGPWLTLVHQGRDDIQIELALDECGGVFIKARCGQDELKRVRAMIARYVYPPDGEIKNTS